MKALVWKELRENFRWALLAAVALGAGEFYALYHQQYPGQSDFYFNDGITLCRKPFLMATLFGSAVVGIALGLLQVLPELKRDRWAALLHRPVSSGQIFWGKAVSGVLLYLFAAGLPLLAVIWRVATPGNFATPFVPEMIKPGFADLITGLCYYFAALLVALQRGGKLLRAVPIFAAVHVSFFALEENLFRVAVEAAVVMSIALCVAGWGAIHSREMLRGRPWLARVAFFVVVFYGVCGLGELMESLGGMAGYKGDRKFSAWEILDNGVPAREDYVNSVLVTATDVDGKPFADAKYRPDRIRSHTLGINIASSYIGDSHGYRPREYPRNYRESNSYLYGLQPYNRPRLEQWFHLYKSSEYVGVSPVDKKVFARLGATGFAPPERPVPGFSKDTEGNQIGGGDILMLAAPDSLRIARLGRRDIVPIDLPVSSRIYGMGHAWARIGNSSVDFQGVALEKEMAVYDIAGKVVARLPYHQDVDRWGELSMGVIASMDRFVLHYQPSNWIEWKTQKTMPSYVEVMDSKGNVHESFTLPPLPPNVNSERWSGYVADRLRSPTFFFGEMLYQRIGAAFGSSRLRKALDDQLRSKSTFREGVALVSVAVILSLIVLPWARRAQLPRHRVWAWSAAVFALGLPGFILFWLAGERPRTVPCPACSRPRRIDRESCASCAAAWPASALADTEIIDRNPTPELAASI